MISVIIPTFNREKYITETIMSVYNQDYNREIEIIVVDDGSTDGTAILLEKLKCKISFLKVITTKNSGVSSARNKGLSIAKGNYIQFLDSDDLIAPTKFRLQIKLLEENSGYDLCYSSVGFFTNNLSKVNKLFPGSNKKYKEILPVFLYATQWTTHSPLYKKSACKKIGLWNQKLSRLEDWEYGCRAGLMGLKPLFCNEVLAFVREHEGERLSKGNLEYTALALEIASKSIIENMKKSTLAPNSWFNILAKHLLSAGRAFALAGQEKASKRCLKEAILTTKSKKLKIGINIYMIISNIVGYKNLVILSKKILRRNLEQKL